MGFPWRSEWSAFGLAGTSRANNGSLSSKPFKLAAMHCSRQWASSWRAGIYASLILPSGGRFTSRVVRVLLVLSPPRPVLQRPQLLHSAENGARAAYLTSSEVSARRRSGLSLRNRLDAVAC